MSFKNIICETINNLVPVFPIQIDVNIGIAETYHVSRAHSYQYIIFSNCVAEGGTNIILPTPSSQLRGFIINMIGNDGTGEFLTVITEDSSLISGIDSIGIASGSTTDQYFYISFYCDGTKWNTNISVSPY